MIKLKRTFVWIPSLLIAILIMAACGSDGASSSNGAASGEISNNETNTENAESMTIRVGHVVAEDHVLNLANVKFKEEVEKNSDGRITVEIFPRQQLGGEADMMEQVKNGTLDMITPTIATLTSRSNSFNAWYMPYLLGSVDATYEMTKTDIAQDVLNSLDASEGVYALGYYTIDNRNISSPKRISSVDDFEGLRIRIPPGQAIGDFYSALGASPTPIEQQEVYNALQTGVVDAVDADADAVMSNRYFEVAKYLTLTGHHDWVIAVMYSQTLWDQLSEEDREIIENAVRAAEEYSYEQTLAMRKELLAAAQENGVEVVEFEDGDALRVIAEDIHEKYSDDPLIAEFIEQAKEISDLY